MSYNSPFSGDVVQPTDVSFRAVTLSSNTQLQWPINGNSTTDYSARIMDVTATTGGLSLYMPPADQTSVGNDALIRNVGSNTFTVKTYDGNGTIVTVAAGEAKYIYVKTNPDVYGTWGIISFGAGTSSADASALAGYGLLAMGATLNQSHPSSTMTAGYAFQTSDRAKVVVWDGGATTADLPASSTTGDNWFTLFKNSGTGTVTISATVPELIDGAVSKAFAPGESAFIISIGTGYITVGYGVSTQFEFGVLTKPVTAGTYTLTASEASNTIQIYNGTLAGDVTIIVPPVINFYVISNQCNAGGYKLTITTGVVGSSSAEVPPSGQATLVCDSANILNANTTQAGGTAISLVNGTALSPSLNFGSETDTGIYRPGAGQLGISVLGTEVVNVNASGVDVDGVGNFTNGISGGVFV